MPTKTGIELKSERLARENADKLERMARENLSAQLMSRRVEAQLERRGPAVLTGQDLAQRLEYLYFETLGTMYRAKREGTAGGDQRGLSALKEARSLVMAQAQLLGIDKSQQNQQVAEHDEKIRLALTTVLRRHPWLAPELQAAYAAAGVSSPGDTAAILPASQMPRPEARMPQDATTRPGDTEVAPEPRDVSTGRQASGAGRRGDEDED